MENRFIPIGSIVAENGIQMMVVGYTAVKTEQGIRSAYSVIPHPLGFMNDKIIKTIACNRVQVIHMGYESKYTEVMGNYCSGVEKLLETAPQHELEKLLKMGEE